MRRYLLAILVGMFLAAPRAIAQDSGGRYFGCWAAWSSSEAIFHGGAIYKPKTDTGPAMVCVGLDYIPYLLTAKNGNPTDLHMLSLAFIPIDY